MEAITKAPSRTARKPLPPPSLPASAHTSTPSGAGSGRSKPWKRSPNPLAHSAKAPSFPELPQRAQDRFRGAPQIRPAERDQAGASLGSDHQSPSRKARKLHPPPSFLSERRPDPAERPKYAKRSGIGPERALKAITKSPRAQRESSILPRASSASVGPIPRSAHKAPLEGYGLTNR